MKANLRIVSLPGLFAPQTPATAPRIRLLLLGGIVAALAGGAWAQEGSTGATGGSALPGDLQHASAGGTRVVSPRVANPNASPLVSPLQWGVLDVRPHLFYRLLSGNGIQSGPGQQTTTTINAISPGVLFGIGDHWTLDYTPTKTYYSSRAFKNSLDHTVLLNGGTGFEAWTFGLSGSFASTDQPLVETAAQTYQKTWTGSANLGYQIGSRVALDFSGAYTDQAAERFVDSREWSTSDWCHYQIATGWDTAIGFGAGTVNVSAGPNMSYTRPQVQIGWKATQAISLNVQGGIEDRTFHGGARPRLRTPTFGATLRYQPLETTALTLGSSRTVAPSYFSGEIIRGTSVTAGLEQRLLEHFHLGVGISHQKSTYLSSILAAAAGRDDSGNSFNLRLSTTLRRTISVALLYQDSHNSSSQANYAYSSHQVGLELGWRF